MEESLYLKKGDIVDIVSPGSNSRPDDVESALQLLEGWGLKPRLPKETFSEHPFHSNEDKVRLELLKRALLAKDSKLIWCLRGGYGANRLLQGLSRIKAPKKKKLLVGYSDITSINVFLKQKWKWPSIHGPLLETLISGRVDPESIEDTRKILFGELERTHYEVMPMNEAAVRVKSKSGILVGGNLVVLQSTLATPFQIQTKNNFLFIEEIGERGYRIDRMLYHLEESGALKGCLGILLGDFLLGDEKDKKNYVQFALERFANTTKLPVFCELPTGHGNENLPLVIGGDCKIEIEDGRWFLVQMLKSGSKKRGKKR